MKNTLINVLHVIERWTYQKYGFASQLWNQWFIETALMAWWIV